MPKSFKTILAVYFVGLILVVLLVPWKADVRYGFTTIQKEFGYAFVLNRPAPAAKIDYGVVTLEALLITALAGLALLVVSAKRSPGREQRGDPSSQRESLKREESPKLRVDPLDQAGDIVDTRSLSLTGWPRFFAAYIACLLIFSVANELASGMFIIKTSSTVLGGMVTSAVASSIIFLAPFCIGLVIALLVSAASEARKRSTMVERFQLGLVLSLPVALLYLLIVANSPSPQELQSSAPSSTALPPGFVLDSPPPGTPDFSSAFTPYEEPPASGRRESAAAPQPSSESSRQQ